VIATIESLLQTYFGAVALELITETDA